MNFVSRRVFPAIIIALVLVSCAFATTTYTKSFNNANSVTVTANEHGFSTSNLGVVVTNAAGTKYDPINGQYQAVVNNQSYQVTVTFYNGNYTGYVKITQGLPSSDTSATTDFQAVKTGAYGITVCGQCTDSSPALRTIQDSKMSAKGHSDFTLGDANNGYIYVSIYNGKMRFDVGGMSGTATNGATIGYEYDFPSGSFPIQKFQVQSGYIQDPPGVWDYRPWK